MPLPYQRFWPVDLRRTISASLYGRSRSSRLRLNFPWLDELVGVPVKGFLRSLVRNLRRRHDE